MKFFRVTVDGDYLIGTSPRNTQLSLLIADDLGGGTVTVGTQTADTTFRPFTVPAPFAAVGNAEFLVGKGQKLVLNLGGATSPDLLIGIAADYFEFDDSMQPFRAK